MVFGLDIKLLKNHRLNALILNGLKVFVYTPSISLLLAQEFHFGVLQTQFVAHL